MLSLLLLGGQAFEKGGIRVEFEMAPVARASEQGWSEGDIATFRFAISDTLTGSPMGGLFPAAWMDLVPPGEPEQGGSCKKKVQSFIGGSLLTPAELNLNVYYVLAMNNDASISVVDPLFGFGTTKLLDMIVLEAPAQDWALSRDQRTLYVSMPKAGKVAAASLLDWEVQRSAQAGSGVSRIALQPDGRYLWAAFDKGVAVFDAGTLERKVVVETGSGRKEIVFAPDSRWAFASSAGDGVLTVVDVRTLDKKSSLDLGGHLGSLAYSQAAEAVYALDSKGALWVVDGARHEVRARIPVEPGASQIRFAPDGRLAFLVNPAQDIVQIVDASVNRVIQTGDTERAPDQVAFSDELAYIRHRDSELVLMSPLKELGHEGAPVPLIDFPGGRTPLGKGMPSRAPSIVQAPGATAVLVANAADTAIYYYKEGMAAPMGHFQNYGRQPRAVLAVDRSLKEARPGVYETSAALRRPGRYDVAFFLDSPRTIHCFQVEVGANPGLEAERRRRRAVDVEAALARREYRANQEVVLRFRLKDAVTGKPLEGVEDLRILSFRAPGFDQRRMWAEEVGAGLYEVRFTPAEAGAYYAFASSLSLGLAYKKSPFAVIRVRRAEAPAAGHESR